MLEFREDFFEQEIREGFYIDTTMKTVWASELELLQLVAEVCDRHGLTWYACYGTLLGAIRHEGFVPWDDDMDIVMKRKDYMKLLEVLPKELPEGYSVRSPQTDVGYEQYHTCINNGNGICITQEWLARNHGCPFTIGLDIFPLDNLPRNEEKRKMQRNLVSLAGHLAQMAGVLAQDENLPACEGEKTIREYKKDLKDGIKCLEQNCKIKFDHKLIKEEKWDEARSELWRLTNEFAMMYDEEESDYLALYPDYIQWEGKIFPQEWFAEVWSASFEGFMLPIPCKYHELLCNIYGDYWVYYRKCGMHEYPYYARQLRQLREYVKDVEKRAGQAGIIAIEELEVQEESIDIPAEWMPIVTKSDGSLKKIILSANDPIVYMAYGDDALDKLESTLKKFEEVSSQITLWWRPQPVMGKLLGRISPKLADRYQTILDNYKDAGWGICDETDNTDRAVAQCDVYYGEMNAILQPFQNAGKGVIIAHMGEVNYRESNEARIKECQANPNFTDYVEIGEKRYYVSPCYNEILEIDIQSQELDRIISFGKVSKDYSLLHGKCVEIQGKICVLPVGASNVYVYDTANDNMKEYELEENKEVPTASWMTVSYANNIYLLPGHNRQKLWRWDVSEDAFEQEMWWKISSEGSHLRHGIIDETRFYTLQVYTNELYITDLKEKTVRMIRLPDAKVARIQYDGENYFYVANGCTDVVQWNEKQGIIMRYTIKEELYNPPKDSFPYLDIHYSCNKLVMISQDGSEFFCLNLAEERIEKIGEVYFADSNLTLVDKNPYYKLKDNSLMILRQYTDEVATIRLDTMEVRLSKALKHLGDGAKRLSVRKMFDKGSLLYEDDELVNLQWLLKNIEKIGEE